nr:OB-fold nucleic acid binding domain-containing protein [Desulfobacula sp.]
MLNPDVNKSDIQWKGHNFKLRVGLLSIRDLSAKTMKTIIVQRNRTPFSSLEDFFVRVNPREDEARALIHSGSLDSLDNKDNRASLLWAFASWQKRKKKTAQQPSLFDRIGFDHTGAITAIPDLPAENPVEKLRREFFVLGFLCTCHPIVLFKDIIQQHNTVKAKHLPKFTGKKVIFAGWLITGKVVKTKHGDPMKFLTFEDETGIIETIFFPKPYALFCHMLDYGKPYLLYGKLDSSWGAITLTVEKTRPIHILI